ncbi:CPCC family cysteine-rich protein [Brevibacillus brevis]
MDPDSDGGANNLLLQEAQRNFIRLGACGSW